MRKLIFIFLIVTFSFSNIKGLSKLLDYIFPLVAHKSVVKIYTLPFYYQYFYNYHFIIVKDCKKSDIIFGNIKCKNKPIFTLNYDFYKKTPNAFGVFYYRKGRPQLKLKKKVLKKFFKKIPNEIKGYVQ